jgi:membrane-bound inhibitor of C-type lysozyme
LKKIKFAFIVGVLCILGVYLAGMGLEKRLYNHLLPPSANTITYFCHEGIIKATYMAQKVRLVLPDGRKFDLPQVTAASGIRYSNGTIEFWSKGANAFVTANSKIIYSDGIAGTVRFLNRNTAVFIDSGKTFSFHYPRGFGLSGKGIGFTTDWRAGATESGMVLALVTIPKSHLPQTNFNGAEFIVGQSSDPRAIQHCFEKLEGYGARMEQVKIKGVFFIKFTFSDAGAGNLYETVSYRTKRGDACYVVEYTIHSSNIGMYSPDQGIQEFNKAVIENLLEKMVGSFRFLR